MSSCPAFGRLRFGRDRPVTTLESPRIAEVEAPALIEMGAETTVDDALGREERRGLVSILALPST